LLGLFENFPEAIHGRARFSSRNSVRDLQLAILSGVHQLNHEVHALDTIVPHLSHQCEVCFELGAAEDMVFNYVNQRELKRFRTHIMKTELRTLDILCAIQYHTVNKKGKRVPLKFDYHLIRFTFRGNGGEMLIHHERGTQRIPLEKLILFVANNINEELARRSLQPLNIETLQAL